ncbi:uncharacterized protein LOC131145792 [Malania oleifera]|uniref:uncharacterized protein LOC131145792 n=1 Tax=Malania oleifera TaxID=397392 RepID=UPI0025AE91FE|nr:uncharacterized protein LOC131145792 [Malania oleifera]
MDIAHIFVGRQWLYDLDVSHNGRYNTYSFRCNGKRIILNPLEPKCEKKKKEKKETSGESLNTISKKLREQENQDTQVVAVDVTKRIEIPLPEKETSLEVSTLPSEIKDVISSELPPVRKIPHVMDLVPYSSLRHLPHPRVNSREHEILMKQLNELKEIDFVHKSLGPLACPTFPNPKEDNTLSICIDNRAINKIVIENSH